MSIKKNRERKKTEEATNVLPSGHGSKKNKGYTDE